MMTTSERIEWSNLFFGVARSMNRVAWWFVALNLVFLLLAWYFSDGGIGKDQWEIISPNGDGGGSPVERATVVRESVLA